ncbi:hypothetical protein FNV43_RR18433 [Rhamnella rubrinervis]|uniref:Uncharacterized protein n=1 Tax=Rhamnella rubrinervis TaxID=2594499 RepID=A0A8K0GY24_9ROSA|nr:hypothetical protein FNV43_RR18433 [Rhamnella rubrinervis]
MGWATRSTGRASPTKGWASHYGRAGPLRPPSWALRLMGWSLQAKLDGPLARLGLALPTGWASLSARTGPHTELGLTPQRAGPLPPNKLGIAHEGVGLSLNKVGLKPSQASLTQRAEPRINKGLGFASPTGSVEQVGHLPRNGLGHQTGQASPRLGLAGFLGWASRAL